MLSRIHTSRILVSRRNLLPYVRHASRKVIRPFKLADIGEGITECEIIRWNVKPSSTVQHFDPLCEVQSDKATVEITSPFDGIVKEIMVKEGEIAKVGRDLCTIEVEEEEEDASGQETSEPRKADELAPQVVQQSHPPSQIAESAPIPIAAKRKHPLDPSAGEQSKSSDAHVLATPSVRHFARQSGISDMSILGRGSGRDGRIEKKDIEAHLQRGTAARETLGNGVTTLQAPGEDVRIDLGRTRYAMWKSMTKSLEIPHFGYSSILDLTALNALIPSMNSFIPLNYNPPAPEEYPPAISPKAIWGNSPPGTVAGDLASQYKRLTILPLLLKALSRAMQDWPVFRSSLNSRATEDERPSITVRPHSDIAIAVSTSSGLYTPVIQSVDTKTPYEIMGELRRFQSLGRQSPAAFTFKEMPKRGATISVSNVGAIGKGEFAAPLLVPGGGVAIVAIGRAKWVERGGQQRLEVGVSWSADHRIVEGAEMAAFVESWRTWVEEPARLIADGR